MILDKNNYHFIGIGGIGISAIAQMLLRQGKKVSGSDQARSEITDDLEKLGAKIFIGHKAENITKDVEAVIYTIAIPDSNPEMQEARNRVFETKSAVERTSTAKRGQESGTADFVEKPIIIASYPEALGELSKQKYTIAISGTHGKTTTTAMIGHILQKAGLEPTIVVGSKMLSENENKESNFYGGAGKYLVVEACEYRRSFLNLSPQILVITNIEADHLDYYKDLADIESAFDELKAKVPKDGQIITEAEYEKVEIKKEDLLIPGKHNIKNAQAAMKAAEAIGISAEEAKEHLRSFRGTWRRLEYKGAKQSPDLKIENIFYDDYAHHPSEIKASLSALRERYPEHRLIAIFEPHQQSRTKLLFDDFVQSLSIADQVFIAPIYKAREVPDPTISNQILAEAVNKFKPSMAVEGVDELKEKITHPHPLLLQEMESNTKTCIVLMGAGDIYKWTPTLLS